MMSLVQISLFLFISDLSGYLGCLSGVYFCSSFPIPGQEELVLLLLKFLK